MIDLSRALNLSRSKLPVILQTEAAECGLASLAMIACHHGFETDLAALRRRFTLSLKGATLSFIMQAAGRLNLAPRPLRAELEDLPKLRTPCVLHWDMNHFVPLLNFEWVFCGADRVKGGPRGMRPGAAHP